MLECAGARGWADLPVAGLLGGRAPRTRSTGAAGYSGQPRRNARTGRSPQRDRPVPVSRRVVGAANAREAGRRKEQGAPIPQPAAARAPVGARPRSVRSSIRATTWPRYRLRAPRRARRRHQGRRSPTRASALSALFPPGNSARQRQRRGQRVPCRGPITEIDSRQHHIFMNTGAGLLSPHTARSFRPGRWDRETRRCVPTATPRPGPGRSPPACHSAGAALGIPHGGARSEAFRDGPAAAWWIPPQKIPASPDGPAAGWHLSYPCPK